MALALHHPSKLKKENRGILKMSKQQMHEYASTPSKNLPAKKGNLMALAGMKKKKGK